MYSDLKTSAVAILAGLAATATAITGPGDFCYGPYFSMYNRGGKSMSYQRLDPAINPGVESPHLHSFDGGNNIGSTLTTAELQASTCTTNRIKQDKSIYWNPTLHFKNDTGFYLVPEIYKKVYYKYGDNDVTYKPDVFPKDFMMIAGESKARSDDDMVADAGVSWACLGDNYSRIGDKPGFPSGFTSCTEGLATQLTFPSCWNGNPINPKEPNAHMAYPTGPGTGIDKCPTGFQKARFPAIFIEFWWDVTPFDGYYTSDETPWALSNGDPTGKGFHADFANGWEEGVLEKTIGADGLQCGCGCGNDEFNAFFGEENVNQDGSADFDACFATPEFPGDDVEFLEKLPGCNPLQYGPALATAVTGAGCSATAISTPKATYASAATSLVVVSTVSSSAASSVVSSAVSSVSSSSASSVADTSAVYTSTSVQAADVSSTESPAKLSLSLPGKGVSEATTTSEGAAYSTGSASFVFLSETGSAPASETTVAAVLSGVVPGGPEVPYSASSLAVASETTAAAVGSSAVPGGPEVPYSASSFAAVSTAAAVPTSPSESGCKAPVYVTITPTVYVTAGAVGTGGCAGKQTVYTTVTNTETVTVGPGTGGYKPKHRRHLAAHLHKH
ncbi:uncharacterized protein BDZ99DRAFT_463723 [Mytilinidion resinicola]|uniref:DUF1996 domain-containing protein n=1 Tax=Mytilinidion resinicola TaxID=574789 RepID=A0A6A6YLK5_9PEZI|nr:uncharacterized protein BDZ99DRAFT_463723 [Mytilinidion resinicola]KAF2808864.1 hypothetical protein BDZ99DRAFT_463723 [Mytilinidion resinicola]